MIEPDGPRQRPGFNFYAVAEVALSAVLLGIILYSAAYTVRAHRAESSSDNTSDKSLSSAPR